METEDEIFNNVLCNSSENFSEKEDTYIAEDCSSNEIKLYIYNKNDSSELTLDKKEFHLNVWKTIDNWFEVHYDHQKTTAGLIIKKSHAIVGNCVNGEVKMRTIISSYNRQNKTIELRINRFSDLYVDLLKENKVTIYIPLNSYSSKVSRVVQFFASLRETDCINGFDNESYFETFDVYKLNLTERHREQYDGNSISSYYEIINDEWTLAKTKKYYYTGLDAEKIKTNFR